MNTPIPEAVDAARSFVSDASDYRSLTEVISQACIAYAERVNKESLAELADLKANNRYQRGYGAGEKSRDDENQQLHSLIHAQREALNVAYFGHTKECDENSDTICSCGGRYEVHKRLKQALSLTLESAAKKYVPREDVEKLLQDLPIQTHERGIRAIESFLAKHPL